MGRVAAPVLEATARTSTPLRSASRDLPKRLGHRVLENSYVLTNTNTGERPVPAASKNSQSTGKAAALDHDVIRKSANRKLVFKDIGSKVDVLQRGVKGF
jgi:hypothetical protein